MIYVAAAFQDYHRARAAMKTLRVFGHEVTHDWTSEVGENPDGECGTSAQRRAYAEADLDGVRSADLVLLLTPESKAKWCGCWFESGAAVALGKRLVITGPQRERSVFCFLAEARFESDEDAVVYLTRPDMDDLK